MVAFFKIRSPYVQCQEMNLCEAQMRVQMEVSILIVSYNTSELTLACIDSVRRETRAARSETIVVDNASTDGSTEAIAHRFPQAELHALTANWGFSAANNIAGKHAAGEFLLLLNPDTVILDGAIDKALAFARTLPKPSIVGGRTYFADGTLNPTSCHGRPTPWSTFCIGTGLASVFRRSSLFNPESLGSWKRDTVREVDAVTGCFLLIPRKVWEELGGFDESFFMYGEETDLCLRARKIGVPSIICPDAKLIHYGGASEKVRADKMVRLFSAKALLFSRHWSPASAWFGRRMLDLWALTRMTAFSVLGLFRPRYREQAATWRSIWKRRRTWWLPPEGPAPAPTAAVAS